MFNKVYTKIRQDFLYFLMSLQKLFEMRDLKQGPTVRGVIALRFLIVADSL
jgi:hypothetical protein